MSEEIKRVAPRSELDEASYWKRVKRVFDIMDIRTLFITSKQLEEALYIIDRSRNGEYIEPNKLQWSKKVKDAIIHPETNEKVFLPLRISMIIPMNMILDSLMISANTRTAIIAAQTLNQVYNAFHYHANRNASATDEFVERIQAFSFATISSVTVAVTMPTLANRLKWKYRPYIKRIAPFMAVAVADIFNLASIRRKELISGIDIFDEETGEYVGTSNKAGLLAVSSCITARITAAAPVLIIPSLVMHRLRDNKFLTRRPYLRMPLLLGMVGTLIQIAVPLTFGLFKQTNCVSVKRLENKFHNIKRKKDNTFVTNVIYNKGL